MTRLCGAYADHVDHVLPLSVGWPGLRRAGSTSRWRRLRLVVLDRDGWRCQLPVDDAGDLVPEDLAALQLARPPHPDELSNLRAACARHNLQRGDARRAVTQPRRQPADAQPWKW